MRVTDIDIRDLKWDDFAKCFRGSVSMAIVTKEGAMAKQLNYICQSRREFDAPSSLITYDLVTHALEQARTMPGLRKGDDDLHVDITAAVERLPFASRRSAAG